jgi:aspartyl-tRNA(Asn)/glutamyl-tRNA(Gln) amidotransferase subunit C
LTGGTAFSGCARLTWFLDTGWKACATKVKNFSEQVYRPFARRETEEKFMALTRDEVLHVANLARLTLGLEEIELFTRQLNDILAYVEKLQELDTTGVEPLAHVIPVFNVFREDVVRDGLDRDTALGNAPAREEGAFVVPRVI